jgi:ABC-type dipeptide/oligopeptide/nickel transport system ATPase component
MTAPLLEIEGLTISLAGPQGRVDVVKGAAFQVQAGEALGVVGESGSGKSLSMLAILGLLPPGVTARAVRARFAGGELLGLPPKDLQRLRGRQIAMVFQDPLAALNPVLSIGRQITEVLRRHFGHSQAQASQRALELLAEVGVPDPALRLKQFPHEFSGGMRQRVTIAMALAGEPRLLIADEPTTALDVTVQAEIVGLVKRLQRERGMAIVWVTHDLALLARIADRVAVMRAGEVVETAAVDDLFAAPAHPYTRGLLASIPRVDQKRSLGGAA